MTNEAATLKPPPRPDGCTDEVLTYLDELRASGVTNMFGAGPYLIRKFSCSRTESHKWLSYWMQSFGKGDR